MFTAEEIKLKRKQHRENNAWLRSVNRPTRKMPFNLMTAKERARDARSQLKRQRNREDKRQQDLVIKEAFGIKLPYEWLSAFLRGAGDDKRVRVIEKRQLMSFSRVDANICNGMGRRLALKFMMFDIDSDLSVSEFASTTGVAPTFFVGKLLPDGKMQRPHAIIELQYPVKIPAGTFNREFAWFERLYDLMFERLHEAGVDVDYGQKTTFKNPDFDEWDVQEANCGARTLRQLQDEIDAHGETLSFFAKSVEPVSGLPEVARHKRQKKFDFKDADFAGRNEALFHTVRHAIMADWANIAHGDVHSVSLGLLEDLNLKCGYGLRPSELKGIAKSHAKFFARYRGRANPHRKPRNEGAAKDLILWSMTKRERQAIGAHYTHGLCSKRTLELVQSHKRAHPGVTISATARALGIDRKTARKYFDVESAEQLAAMRKIRELRESVAAHWHAKNLASVVLGQDQPGESGHIRRYQSKSSSVPTQKKAEEASPSMEQSYKFPSSMVERVRAARLKLADEHRWKSLLRRETSENDDFYIHTGNAFRKPPEGVPVILRN